MIIFFPYFSEENSFDIACKLSHGDNLHEMPNLFSGNKNKKKIQCPLLNFLPRVLIVNNVLTCSVLPACKTIIIRSILVLVHSLKEAEINFDSFTTMIYSAKIKKCQSDVIERIQHYEYFDT